jgi:hypothetical protein
MDHIRVLRLVATFIATAVVLGACIPPEQVVVYNRTGGRILLRIDPIHFWHLGDKLIEPGRAESGYLDEMLPPGLVIETRTCSFGYDLPRVDVAYERTDRAFPGLTRVQVEPDFSIVLLPPLARSTLPDAKSLPLQKKYGYPVRPIFKKCGATRSPWVFDEK